MQKKIHSINVRLSRLVKLVVLTLLLQGSLQPLLASHTLNQNLYDVPLELTVQDKSLLELFTLIEGKTEYSFTYNSKKINLAKKISITKTENSLGGVLDKISKIAAITFHPINTVIAVKPAINTIAIANGSIVGKVIDAQLNESLPGATVRILNSNIGTVTDLNGEFTLRAPEGELTLEITYIGFKKVSQNVTVKANSVTAIEVKMTGDSQELANITITGALQGQQRALNQQKSADNIKNVVSADQIGRFPDVNVAEALQRVPAVNIERDQGEGRYVLVRGLAPQFTNISINGEQVPSPEAGVRYVALDAVPADQLASIEVSKAITPDMDGDAIGGSVNLITRTAQSEQTTIKASALMGYNNIVGRANLQGSLEIGKRLFNNKLGVMLNSSYYESDRGSDNWEREGDEMEIRDYELVRTRLGLSSTLDYKFNEHNELYFRTLYNRFSDREQRRRYVLVPNSDNSPFESHEIERATKDRLEKQMVSSFNLGGKHVLPKFTLDYELAYAEAIQDTPFDIEINAIGEFDDLAIDFTSNPYYPSFTVNGVGNKDVSNEYLNNANYEFDEFANGNTYALDINKTAKINLSIPYKLASNEGMFKLGGKVRLKEKSFDIIENVYEWAGGDVTFGNETGDYTLEKFDGGSSGTFLKGNYLIRPNVDVSSVINHFNNNRNGYQLNVEDKLATEAVESYVANEDVFATYAMTKIQMNNLMVLGGVRYEKTNVSYSSEEVYYDFQGDLDEIVPVRGETSYGFILPQLHAKYRINDNTNLRFAATRSYSRPNFEDIVPAQEIDLNAREGNVGNPQLEPVSATNLDLLGEKYFGTVGILSGGVFFKRLNNFIFNRRFEASSFNGRNFGTDILLTQAQNGENANLLGFELAFQQNLVYLPGKLSGLSVYANYTFTNSAATIQSRDDLGQTETIRLPGQAKHVGNLSLGYDIGRLNVRLSSNFNGEYITELGDEASEDLYVRDRMQLDATATFTVKPKFRVFAEFLNLTNQPFEVFQGKETQFVQREFYSWWTRIGVKFDF
jgi:TonB-dependent receptor